MPRLDPKPSVVLVYRRPRETGNFSIETSFDRMLAHYPRDSRVRPRKFVSSHLSIGVVPRLRAILEARRHRGAVNHVTGDVNYLTLGLPTRRTILTIHDIGFMELKHGFAKLVLRYLWVRWPIGHCRVVTAVSDATKRHILKHARCPPDKIEVIPTIIADGFRPVPCAFDVRKPRILHIGVAPNKNLERHIEALKGIPCRFHVIGKLDPRHVALLERHQINYSFEYNIDDDQMRQAYENADLVLFASTLEGFGMPIVEAQTVGRPVVTSNLSSMPEIAGDAACLVDPYDVESIRAGVLRIIEDADYRDSLVQRGLTNALRFDPTTVARQYDELYRRVLADGPRPGST